MRHFAAVLLFTGCFGPPGCEETEATPPSPVDDLAVQVDLTPPPPCDEICNGVCVDITAPDNCGGCGITCASGKCDVTDGGVPLCRCDPDGGTPGCGFAEEPACSAGGHCTCGGDESGVCDSTRASQCKNGQCLCGDSEAPCGDRYTDHCDPAQSPSCRCGDSPRCDPTRSESCGNGQCLCGDKPECGAGFFCCEYDIAGNHCCTAGLYCCLDGCCNHPCLLLGFCAE